MSASETDNPPSRRLGLLLRLEPLIRALQRLRLGWLPTAVRKLVERVGGDQVEARVEGLRMRAPIAERGYLQLLSDRAKDRHLVELFEAAVQPGARVLDGGAHWGYFTLLAAKAAGPSGAVVAFEPDPRSFERLRWNVQANELGDRVRLVNAALADHEGEQPLFTHPLHHSWTSLFELPGSTRTGSIETLSADHALGDDGPIDVVKLDVEGSELQALRGMRRMLGSWRPTLFLECHPTALSRAGSSVGELLSELRAAGYAAQAIDERDGSLNEVTEALAGAPFVNLRCVPG